jgi:glycerol uptake facilitator-like aquaporin
MEKENGSNIMLAVIICEFFGTAFFELAYNLNDGNSYPALVLATIILLTQHISGGHINPAVSLAVYIERQKYLNNLCFMLLIMFAQFLGAFTGFAFSYLLRTTIPITSLAEEDINQHNKWVYVPDQNPFYPKILDKVGTVPAYGQVLLAETMGTLVYILV